jgi:methionine synthase II (cobalamin-independent)
VDPDCGLKTRTVDEAIAKMQSVATAAKALRAVTSDK